MNSDKKAIETANPLRRIGRPEEVADSVVFLAGPGATPRVSASARTVAAML